MNPGDLETLLRKVVREELAALLSAGEAAAVCPSPARPVMLPFSGDHPFLLSDDELRFAEAGLPLEEQPILRKRVMAARLDKLGTKEHRQQAERLRRQASRAEAALQRAAA